jgi:hypothetical protein
VYEIGSAIPVLRQETIVGVYMDHAPHYKARRQSAPRAVSVEICYFFRLACGRLPKPFVPPIGIGADEFGV